MCWNNLKAVPSRISTYITEQKASSVPEAAELADDYVLTHKSNYFDFRKNGDSFDVKIDRVPRNSVSTCNYCRGKGHWKCECPVLKAKGRKGGNNSCIKPFALATPVIHSVKETGERIPNGGDSLRDGTFAPFITHGSVSIAGSDTKVNVTILRDTGASESFILKDMLPFSSLSDTGTSALIRGIGLEVLSVPLHKIKLTSDLVNGEVVIGVHPLLPVEGVDMILGNN